MEAVCAECGAPAEHDHHVIPASSGGTFTIPLCHVCHGKAHSTKLARPLLIRNALDRKRELKEWVGRRPFGYEPTKDGKLKEVACEQNAAKRAKELRANGVSWRKVTTALRDEGFRTRDGKVIANATLRRAVARAAKVDEGHAIYNGGGSDELSTYRRERQTNRNEKSETPLRPDTQALVEVQVALAPLRKNIAIRVLKWVAKSYQMSPSEMFRDED